MNQKELQLLVESISINDFQRPFNHQATFNSRLNNGWTVPFKHPSFRF
ncbi:hypothetical protein AB6852_13545 [Carnobacterium divergens]